MTNKNDVGGAHAQDGSVVVRVSTPSNSAEVFGEFEEEFDKKFVVPKRTTETYPMLPEGTINNTATIGNIKSFIRAKLQQSYEQGRKQKGSSWREGYECGRVEVVEGVVRVAEKKHGWDNEKGVYYCSDGEHLSWWRAIQSTDEWKQWYDHASKNMLYDVDECQECGWMSENHAKDFMQFVKAHH